MGLRSGWGGGARKGSATREAAPTRAVVGRFVERLPRARATPTVSPCQGPRRAHDADSDAEEAPAHALARPPDHAEEVVSGRLRGRAGAGARPGAPRPDDPGRRDRGRAR